MTFREEEVALGKDSIIIGITLLGLVSSSKSEELESSSVLEGMASKSSNVSRDGICLLGQPCQ